MAIFNAIDTGLFSLNQGPSSGVESGSVVVQGGAVSSWARAGKVMTRATTINVQAPFAIGGAAAGSRQAVRYVVQQLVELAHNPNLQPVYIQWESGNGVLTPNPYDGWYRLDDVTPLDFTFNTFVPCRVSATWVAPPPPRSVAMAYAGAALPSNYSGTAQNILELPFGSTPFEGSFNRTHATGIQPPTILSPVASPESFGPPSAIANLFKSGVEVYDTINTGTNPVPTSGGTYVHANWVQVFDPQHNFQGDCVITNGLQLLWLPAGQALNAYLWNTALPTPNWQLWALLSPYDQAGNGAQIRSYSLIRVGSEEVGVVMAWSTAAGQVQRTTLRLQRGHYEVRVELSPLTQALSANLYMNLSYGPGTANRITYNPSRLGDALLSEGALAVDATYGYAAEIVPSAAFPFIWGWLYQNQPGNQPNAFANASLTLGDTVALAIGASRSYGIFAVPYGVSGTYSPANLQQEMESATLAGGMVSVADAGASAGNTAKIPSGTAIGATATQTLWSPSASSAGSYDVWARVKVTSNASGTKQLRLGMFEGASWGGGFFTDWSPSQFTTAWAWYRVVTGAVFPTGHQWAVRAEGVTNAAATDLFIDEIAIAPKTLTADNRGPQDIWQQFMYDRSAVLVPS